MQNFYFSKSIYFYESIFNGFNDKRKANRDTRNTNDFLIIIKKRHLFLAETHLISEYYYFPLFSTVVAVVSLFITKSLIPFLLSSRGKLSGRFDTDFSYSV
jgi:hypothetical protein